jgi:hypothetical protein
LRQLVLAGIPIVLRPKVWSILAQVRTYKSQFPITHFTDLLAQSHTSSVSTVVIDSIAHHQKKTKNKKQKKKKMIDICTFFFSSFIVFSGY